MKDNFSHASHYQTKPLEASDAAAYRDYAVRVFGEEDARRFIKGAEPQEEESWKEFLSQPDEKKFGLFHDEKIVGTTAISFEGNTAIFTGSFIDPAYRGKGLAQSLHDTRLRYLGQINFTGAIETKILPSNIPSQKAAEKAGFEKIGASEDAGVVYNRFRLTPEALG